MWAEFFHNPETKKKGEEELSKKKEVLQEQILDYMVDDYDNKKGNTFAMLDKEFNNLRPEVAQLVKSFPLSILIANYTTEKKAQLKYVEHLRNCGVPYLDAYKICATALMHKMHTPKT